MHLYSSFINQHINAPRILIVESAFDLCNRSGLIRARDNAHALAILVLVNGVDLTCINAIRLGVHNKARSANSGVCRTPAEVSQMLDFAMIAMGVGFFVASILYVLACERM